MSDAAVHVAELRKTFDVPEREAGLKAATKSLVRRKTREVRAVDAISFDIEHGEVVGFLGPNGAGKTTTLKMLSGLLYPTDGEARVLGHVPSKRERSSSDGSRSSWGIGTNCSGTSLRSTRSSSIAPSTGSRAPTSRLCATS